LKVCVRDRRKVHDIAHRLAVVSLVLRRGGVAGRRETADGADLVLAADPPLGGVSRFGREGCGMGGAAGGAGIVLGSCSGTER
jgi:hypothetical protein